MPEDKGKPILLLVDGHSLAFRSFYAFSKGGEGGLQTKEGTPTSVTYGFLKSLLDNCKLLSPEGVTIAFDTAEPTFRHKADPNYKANRDVAPDIFFQDLAQLQKILEESLNLPIFTAPGYEADDVLGTLANKASDNGWQVRILTGDRDLFQLVDDDRNIAVLYMGGGPYAKSGSPAFINEAGVKTKLGVIPTKVIDLKALTGDSSDNIPGIRGVGPKTAINLLKENGDLDGIFKILDYLETKGEKATQGVIKGALKEKLKTGKENAYLSRQLAEIMINVPIKELSNLELTKINQESLKNSLEGLELFSLINQLPNFTASFSKGGFNTNQRSISSTDKKSNNKKNTPDEKIEDSGTQPPAIKPQIIETESQLKSLVNKLSRCNEPLQPVAIDTETTSLNPFKAELVGLGFCWGENLDDIAYIPLGHNSQGELKDQSIRQQLPIQNVIQSLTPWLSSSYHPKVLQNAKYDRLIFLHNGIPLEGVVMDTLLADYLSNSTNKHSLDEIAKREYGFTPINFKELVGKGETFKDVDIDTASIYCGMDVYLTRKLSFRIRSQLQTKGSELIQLLEKVEQPLEPILAEMEARGICIDIPYLKELSKELNQTLKGLEEQAYKSAGFEFNLNSPKQLGEILFDKLALDKKKSRKTKTGWSTDANVLERLEADHPLVPLLVEHRTLSKLVSTYVDALPQLVEAETGRVHTDFNQAVTATGRLSSSNPNLQNIPIRTEFSRRIRKAFLPQENWKLISADYSQIELRILAHLSGEEILQEAYKNGDDVHTLTAKILLEKESINSNERRLGKTINFGVIYGMGAQRFARSTGLNQSEAKDFLNRFKERYPKVFSFLELQERLALSKGYVQTLLGRRRYFNFDKNGLGRLLGSDPMNIDLKRARRAGMEAQQLRAAANAPIQGSSADIIKIAMVQLATKLKVSGVAANLLLQVHDELVLEVEPSVIEEVKNIVVSTMENAVHLAVPLVVHASIGDNWMDAK
ncbi:MULTISPECIES: DNA polymerase I [Prochlorococcus]|uniref:DNA polymerase I n=1 Tax=Prochlorococcus marinus (strain SARG / CCMP1375 / SS120) TaxID=167539 RepID=Q7VB64_PROMA|nr:MULTISPECIES: DNA polymerase I [Prochlorococcus]AAQ00279.1 DNA polymerase I 3'-5' exonuclease and polymerase domains [Prochlorococcus marinus subsp. marinus str. CCMP1375]KGG14090.1 DNA polymerasee I [Prochlorococcus marinus str. LG]KGG20742.1 DNA polymerasee I [Prochlorococcus marinus str. SS2]KGG25143.1 DNA polymerasee I [Prochlorococcus marinus str. SS35]KGG33305.1 DNA polymerasee I [Prochlorococcus marinus str. SS51]